MSKLKVCAAMALKPSNDVIDELADGAELWIDQDLTSKSDQRHGSANRLCDKTTERRVVRCTNWNYKPRKPDGWHSAFSDARGRTTTAKRKIE
jgi:hypothetical protein